MFYFLDRLVDGFPVFLETGDVTGGFGDDQGVSLDEKGDEVGEILVTLRRCEFELITGHVVGADIRFGHETVAGFGHVFFEGCFPEGEFGKRFVFRGSHPVHHAVRIYGPERGLIRVGGEAGRRMGWRKGPAT